VNYESEDKTSEEENKQRLLIEDLPTGESAAEQAKGGANQGWGNPR
jgi:hypothetical protein